MNDYSTLAWLLATLGLAVGLILYKMPSSEMKNWGDQLIGYSILTSGFLAIAGSGERLLLMILDVARAGGLPLGDSFEVVMKRVGELPQLYYFIGHSAYLSLVFLSGIGLGSALIPVVGPALANMFSVVSTLPSMALTGTTILSFMLASILTIFVTLAPIVIPIGVVLIAVPKGKTKGIGGWLIAMSIALTVVGPLIPMVGEMACRMEGVNIPEDQRPNCDYNTLLSMPTNSILDVVNWLTSPQGSVVMGAWRYVIGSFVAFSIMSLVAVALSRAIGGVASSLGIG